MRSVAAAVILASSPLERSTLPRGYNPATRVKFIGAPIKRLEDPRLLVGGGRYVDDLARPGMVHAVIVRSPHAHARVVHVDARRALAQKGVLACVTGADLGSVPPIPIRQGAKPAHAAYLQPPLAGDPSAICDQLAELADQGFDLCQLVFPKFPDTDDIQLFLDQVLPHFS